MLAAEMAKGGLRGENLKLHVFFLFVRWDDQAGFLLAAPSSCAVILPGRCAI